MTNRLRKSATLLICLVAVSALAFATGDAESGADSSEEVQLQWLATGPGVQRDFDEVMGIANEMLADYVPNTTFEMEIVPPPDYRQRFDLMMAASEQLDIAWKGWMQGYAEEVNKGSYLPLDDLIDQYAPAIKEEVPSWLLTAGRIDGELYIIPKFEVHYWQMGLHTDNAKFEQYFDLEGWMETVAIDTPYNTVTPDLYDAMEEYMQTLRDAGVGGSGFSPWVFTMPRGEDLVKGPPNWTYTMPAVANVYRPGYEWDFTVLNTYERPETIAFFEKMAEWREEGFIREDMLSLANPRQFENTDAEGYDIWFHNYVNPLGTDYTVETRWSQLHTRVAAEPFPFVQPTPNDGNTIPRTAANPERAIQVMALMQTEAGADFYNTLVWGIEGRHYNEVRPGRIETIDYAGQGNADSPYGLWKWALGNVWNAWLTQADQSDDLFEYYEAQHQLGIESPFTGFNFDTTNVVNELAQIRSVLSEYVRAFMSGYYEEDLYAEFLEKLDLAGVDTLIDETQGQLDAHLASINIPKTGYIQ